MNEKKNIKNYEIVEDNPLFHDTWKLLKNYRDALWNLELAVQQVKHEFEVEYGNSIEEFLESIYLAGADIGGAKLENYARSIERSNKMLSLLTSAVDILRTKHKHGEQYYWLLYYTYLSPQQLQNTEEIIELSHLLPQTPGSNSGIRQHPVGIYLKGEPEYPGSILPGGKKVRLVVFRQSYEYKGHGIAIYTKLNSMLY